MIWINKARQDGDKYVAGLMSEMYRAGKGVGKNYQQADEWFKKYPFGKLDEFWAGTQLLVAAMPNQQLTEIMQRMEADEGKRHLSYRRYYAAVSMRRPNSTSISPDYNQYYGLMVQWGQARVSVRGIYLARDAGKPAGSDEPTVSIVAENALPIVTEGGCSVVTVDYDVARQTTLPLRCNGLV